MKEVLHSQGDHHTLEHQKTLKSVLPPIPILHPAKFVHNPFKEMNSHN